MKKLFVLLSLLFLSVSVFAEKNIDGYISNDNKSGFTLIDCETEGVYSVISFSPVNDKVINLFSVYTTKKKAISIYTYLCENKDVKEDNDYYALLSEYITKNPNAELFEDYDEIDEDNHVVYKVKKYAVE